MAGPSSPHSLFQEDCSLIDFKEVLYWVLQFPKGCADGCPSSPHSSFQENCCSIDSEGSTGSIDSERLRRNRFLGSYGNHGLTIFLSYVANHPSVLWDKEKTHLVTSLCDKLKCWRKKDKFYSSVIF